MQAFSIRPFTPSFAPAVYALAKACLPECWSEAEYARQSENPLSHFYVAVSEDDTELLGFCGLYLVAGEGQIMEIVTSPKKRRQGIGQALLSHMLKQARDCGATTFTLEVRAKNTGARALYEKAGFVQNGLRKQYYHHPTDDAVLMQYTPSV